jgi:hypothetical protein
MREWDEAIASMFVIDTLIHAGATLKKEVGYDLKIANVTTTQPKYVE